MKPQFEGSAIFRALLLTTVGAAAILTPAFSQTAREGEFAKLLAGGEAPLSLRLKDLDSKWQRVEVRVIESAKGGSGGASFTQSLMGGGGQPKVYYTQGRTITLGGKNFLIAYRPPDHPLDMTSIQNLGAAGRSTSAQQVLDMLAPAPKPDTALDLSLLDMSTVAGFESVRWFDLQKALSDRSTMASGQATLAAILFPVFAQARLKAQEASSVSNLKQVALGALMYMQDYDEALPPMKDAASAKKALYPYVKNEAIFKDPRTGESYHVNPGASRKHLATIEIPAEFVLFYEAAPASDGTRAVAFADGHVKRISETDWPQVKRRSRMP